MNGCASIAARGNHTIVTKVRYRCGHVVRQETEKICGNTTDTVKELETMVCPSCSADPVFAQQDDVTRIAHGRYAHYWTKMHESCIFSQAHRRERWSDQTHTAGLGSDMLDLGRS